MLKLETSPHTRGKLEESCHLLLKFGNIPAYAGKALDASRSRVISWKHPRIRGESDGGRSSGSSYRETSPHTRGKPWCAPWYWADSRNIPAYAGKAAFLRKCCTPAWKHPRIRGESTGAFSMEFQLKETSPHTRGKPQHIESIIPFCTVFSIQASF